MKKMSMDVRFHWLKPHLGHEWRGKGQDRKWTQRLVPLSGGIGVNQKGGIWGYTPPPGLFRKFAALNLVPDNRREAEIQVFADEYGDIVAQPQEGTLRVTTEVEIIRKHATMETWCRAAQHMSRAIDLWDGVNDPATYKRLRHLFTRSAGALVYKRVVYKRNPSREGVRFRKDWNFVPIATGHNLRRFPAGDLSLSLRKALQLEIREALTDTETPCHATPYLTPELRLVVYPVNLLAHMWLTLARVVSEEIEERRCGICQNAYFYIGSGPGLRRADKVTCSDACRKRKQRT